MSTSAKLVKKALSKKTAKKGKPTRRELLSTGSTLFNLACSDNPYGGFLKGKYYSIVGDSASGKTWLGLTCFAETFLNPDFKNYRIIHDNAEDGALMDLSAYFGQKVSDKIEAPHIDKDGNDVVSETAEDLYFNLDDAVKKEKPFIYVMDSENALTSAAEQDKFKERKTARRKGNKTAGSYGDGKAKIHSSNLRLAVSNLTRSDSILIMLSQTKDNIGNTYNPKTFSGGRSIKFYACMQIWTSIKKKLTKSVNGKKRPIGILVKVQIKKNRITGKDRTIEFPLYYSTGIDDTGSCIDYLVDEEHWPQPKVLIEAPEFKCKLGRDKLIAYIEENNLETELQEIVGAVWKKIEDATKVTRKKRYV